MRLNGFKISYGFIIFLMALLIVQYAVQVSAGGHPWKTGDWLINYSDGLIRRGLSGSVSLLVAQSLSLNVKWVTFTMQVTIFIALVYLVLKEFNKFKDYPKSIFLLLSPAFAFLFWVNDPSVAFRKEICIYLALVFTLIAFQKRETKTSWYWASLITFAFAGLSHESAVFFLPFFIFAIFNSYAQKNIDFFSAAKFSAPFLIICFAILIVSFFYKGSQQSMSVICESLKQYDLSDDICGGSISWLQYDAKYGFESVLKLGHEIYINYFLLAVLSMLPVFLIRADKYFWLVAFAGAFFMLPLFFIAIDYGRFISMYYTSVVLLAVWTRPDFILKMWRTHALVGFLYSFFWALPNCCKNTPGKGILGNPVVAAFNF